MEKQWFTEEQHHASLNMFLCMFLALITFHTSTVPFLCQLSFCMKKSSLTAAPIPLCHQTLSSVSSHCSRSYHCSKFTTEPTFLRFLVLPLSCIHLIFAHLFSSISAPLCFPLVPSILIFLVTLQRYVTLIDISCDSSAIEEFVFQLDLQNTPVTLSRFAVRPYIIHKTISAY